MPDPESLPRPEFLAELQASGELTPAQIQKLDPDDLDQLERAHQAGGDIALHRELEAIAKTLDDSLKEGRDPVTPGVLAGALLGELDDLIALAVAEKLDERTAAQIAATISHLAAAADSLDRMRAREETETISPAIAPDVAKRAGAALARLARMLTEIRPARGRFETTDGLEISPHTEIRVMPDGYEDLNPTTLATLANGLLPTA